MNPNKLNICILEKKGKILLIIYGILILKSSLNFFRLLKASCKKCPNKYRHFAYFMIIFEKSFFFKFSLEYPKELLEKKRNQNIHNWLNCDVVCIGVKKHDPLGLTEVRVSIVTRIVISFLLFRIFNWFFHTEYSHVPRKRISTKNLPNIRIFGSGLAPAQWHCYIYHLCSVTEQESMSEPTRPGCTVIFGM
jgi:hypothetical protein